MEPPGARDTDELRLAPSHRAELERHAAARYPEEACGLLIGTSRDGVTDVHEVVAARNLARERARDRYDLDPADQLRAEERARAASLEVVGVWHSHPDAPAVPSKVDRDAAWEGYAYVIASVRNGRVEDLRCWRLAGGEFHEARIGS